MRELCVGGAKVTEIRPRPDDGWEVVTQDVAEAYDIVVGADGAWSRVRPLLSEAAPVYEGVVFVELGFEAETHQFVDALTGSGKMFAVGDNRALVAQRNGAGHIRGYAGWRAPETAAWDLAGQSADQVRATTLGRRNRMPELAHFISDADLAVGRPVQR